MSKVELSKICPKCKRLNHQDDARFCIICGAELKNEPLREFYLSLGVPDRKISLEQNDPCKLSGFFPFFLRKIDPFNNLLHAITLHDYPKGTLLSVEIPKKSPIADKSEEIIMTDSLLEGLISQGFEWLHHSEMSTMW
ncbi:zinc ribbon domain-containing protein [Paenibacillus periandrae]|uniref:zinc ribbon domain-containing protein n=1 Tax=Paenibacillus periandrae TaxID=1761741 RepID=UPI001F08C0AB|nr:zinc ribbon domain-containing protein [Paenibacillus periandrae]